MHRWYIEVFHLPPHVPSVVQPPLTATATSDIGDFPETPRLCIDATVSAVYFTHSVLQFYWIKTYVHRWPCDVVEGNDLTQRPMYHRWYILNLVTGGTCGFSNVAIGTRNFRQRNFRRRNFRRTKFSPNGISAARKFRRTEILPNGIFAVIIFAERKSQCVLNYNAAKECVYYSNEMGAYLLSLQKVRNLYKKAAFEILSGSFLS